MENKAVEHGCTHHWRSLGELPFALVRLNLVASPMKHPMLRSSLLESVSDSSSGDEGSTGSGDEGSPVKRKKSSTPFGQETTRGRSLTSASQQRADNRFRCSRPSCSLLNRLSARALEPGLGKFIPYWPGGQSEKLTANIIITAPAGTETTWRQVIIHRHDGSVVAMQRILHTSRTDSAGTSQASQAYYMLPRQGGELRVGDMVTVVKQAGRRAAKRRANKPPPPGGTLDISEAWKSLRSIALFVLCTAAVLATAVVAQRNVADSTGEAALPADEDEGLDMASYGGTWAVCF